MTYDTLGRKNQETLTIAGQSYQMSINYDPANRVQNVTYPDGTFVNHQYNSRNLLATLKYPDAAAASTIDTRAYDTGGRLTTETLGNGLVVTRSYLSGDNLPLAISNPTVGNYTYGWDANKNKTSETVTGSMSPYSSTMNFDNQNRLTSWNRSNGDTQSWALSAVNDWQTFTKNGTAQARTHGPTHEILTVGSATITHDSRGNMTTDEFAIARTYDTNNKVSQAIVPTGSTKGIVGTHTYKYDALGRRVRKTTGGPTPSDVVFVPLGERIYADYPAGTPFSAPTTKYTWGSYIDELVCQVSGTSRLYPHRNQQFSTTAVTDQTGTTTERYSYTSYGDFIILDPTTLTPRTTAPLTRYTYTGREYDHETATYYFRARPYSPTLGRFPSHDPILYPDGWNTYAGWFASSASDPSGTLSGSLHYTKQIAQGCKKDCKCDDDASMCIFTVDFSFHPQRFSYSTDHDAKGGCQSDINRAPPQNGRIATLLVRFKDEGPGSGCLLMGQGPEGKGSLSFDDDGKYIGSNPSCSRCRIKNTRIVCEDPQDPNFEISEVKFNFHLELGCACGHSPGANDYQLSHFSGTWTPYPRIAR